MRKHLKSTACAISIILSMPTEMSGVSAYETDLAG
jgi:hypothetical protein